MATYTDPSTINTDPKDPLTSEFGTAALDNPVAIAEGASGAPRIVPEALGTDLGSGSDSSFSGTVTLFSVTDLDDVGVLLLVGSVTAGTAGGGETASAAIAYAVSDDNGASYGTSITIGTATQGATNDNVIGAIRLTGTENAVQVTVGASSTGGGTQTGGPASATLVGLARK